MKFKKILAALTAITTLSTVTLTGSLSASAFTRIDKYEKFDLEKLGIDNYSDDDFYYNPNGTNTNHFFDNSPISHSYGFNLKESADEDELYDEIESFYPNREYTLNVYYYDKIDCIVSVSDFTTLEEEKKISEKVMNRLVEKDMITSFYDFGELGCAGCFEFEGGLLAYPIELNENFDIPAVQSYLDEKNLDYTAQKYDYKDESGEVYDSIYKILPNKEVTTGEMVNLAYDIYEKFGYKVNCVTEEIATSTAKKDSLNYEEPTTETESETEFNPDSIISDVDEIYNILEPFIDENYGNHPDNVKAEVIKNGSTLSVHFGYGYFKRDSQFDKACRDIRNFIEKNNIESSKVSIGRDVDPPKATRPTKAETTETSEPAVLYGDLNSDQNVSVSDAVLLSKYLVDSVVLSDSQLKSADCLADGKVDSGDSLAILKKIVGTYSQLPIYQK